MEGRVEGGMDYLGVLQHLHDLLQPDVYLEVGVHHGASLALSRSKTIGVDPAMAVAAGAVAGKPWVKLYQTTSDAFFETCDRDATLEGGPLGLVFIDGLHLFEQVLRDLINVERWAAPETVIVLHDVVPPDVPSASRVPQPGWWVGDVWKVVPCLARHRPDLATDVVAAPPSGLLVVRRPDPASTVLRERYEELVREYVAEDEAGGEVAAYLAGLNPTAPTAFLSMAEGIRPTSTSRGPDIIDRRTTELAHVASDRESPRCSLGIDPVGRFDQVGTERLEGEAADPDDERYLEQIRRADVERARGDYDRALDADLEALKIRPRWPHTYFGLARTYYYLQDWPKVVHWTDLGRAMPAPETTLPIDPRDLDYNWIICYTLGLYYTGKADEALDWTRRALVINRHDPSHRHNLIFFSHLRWPGETFPITFSPDPVPTYAVIPVHDRHQMTRTLLDQLGLPPERVIVVDNRSTFPAREALAGLARIVEHPERNISKMWNVGLDLAAAEQTGPFNVAVLNNDLEVEPGFLDALAVGLRQRPDYLIAYPDLDARLEPGVVDTGGKLSGCAFMVRGESGLRADERFVWWYGDDDLDRQGRELGNVVCVGGVHLRHLESGQATATNPELQVTAHEDRERYLAKWWEL